MIEVNWPNEKAVTNSRSSEVATVLMPASSENSRSICCERAMKGTSSSSEARKTTQIIEPTAAMPCCAIGSWLAAAMATVSRIQVPAATVPSRRSTAAKGCRSMR